MRVAVLAWMMPVLDGHQLCRTLKSERPGLYVILMVGQRFLEEGKRLVPEADAYLAKPFEEADIDKVVAHAKKSGLWPQETQ